MFPKPEAHAAAGRCRDGQRQKGTAGWARHSGRRDRERPPGKWRASLSCWRSAMWRFSHKAVASALNYDEFFDPGESPARTNCWSREGARAAIADGRPAWTLRPAWWSAPFVHGSTARCSPMVWWCRGVKAGRPLRWISGSMAAARNQTEGILSAITSAAADNSFPRHDRAPRLSPLLQPARFAG